MCTKSLFRFEKLLYSVVKTVTGNSCTFYRGFATSTDNKLTKISCAKLSTIQDLQLKDFKNVPSFGKTLETSPAIIDQFKDARETAVAKLEVGSILDTIKPPVGTYTLPHPIWTENQLHNVEITKKTPECTIDKMAYYSVQTLKRAFDLFSGFVFGQRNERKWLNRICFLETVAGVPGIVGASARHLKSLRRLHRDYGWIHTLLEEAENERMHLLTALELRDPSIFFKMSVYGSQAVFVSLFTGAYIISPKFCHRFVGYLEEEAVKTYTKCLEDIDHGPMQHWKELPATDLAIRYWKLPEDATMRDVVLEIRADEAHHRVVNHTLASMKEDDFNPYKPGE